jgi:hypothetical protein
MTNEDWDESDPLAKMRARFRLAEEAALENREQALEALRFYFGDQWDDAIKTQRDADGRPCFTLNKLPAIVKQVLNEARQNRPAIQINPVADGADEDIAETIQGLCRHVESNSDAPTAYEGAFTYMVVGGFGSWRVRHDYLPKSFDQDVFIDSIANPFSVYWDPAAVKPDKSDARYCFIALDYTRDAYNELWPKSDFAGEGSFEGLGNRAPGWANHDSCRVVEYFEVEHEDAELAQLTDGRVVWVDEMGDDERIATDAKGKPITRDAVRKRCYRSVSNGAEWLDKREEEPIDEIPIVTIEGDALVIDGQRRVRGMVHDLIEPMKMFNYNSSAIVETMALGTKANWLADIRQIEEFQTIWNQANSRNIPVLPYKSVAGVNSPQKITSEPAIQAMSTARMQSADDLRSISGVYDATQAPNGGEESGKAILARRSQAAMGSQDFTAHLAQGIKRTARLLLKLFPLIYDTARVIRITGADLQQRPVMVHAGQPETVPPMLPPGVEKIFDLSVGTYDVTVSVGPSFETKRQEAVEMLLTMMQAAPNLTPLIGDLVVNEMDFAGKNAIVDRLQKALPPALQPQQGNMDPAALAAHSTQLMQQNQGLMQQVQKLTQMLQNDAIKSASREKVEAIKAESQKYLADARLAQERLKLRSDVLLKAGEQHTKIVHDHALADRQEQHDSQMQLRDHVHKLLTAPAPEPHFTQ